MIKFHTQSQDNVKHFCYHKVKWRNDTWLNRPFRKIKILNYSLFGCFVSSPNFFEDDEILTNIVEMYKYYYS